MKRVTINDIAQICGTSKATVSYVINGRVSKVSPEMVRKVEEAIKETGYVPSLSAKSLAGKGSKLIGVIIPQMDVSKKMIFDNPFYSEFISGIEYYLRNAGYSIVLRVVNTDNCFADMMMKWNLDGAVVFGIDNDKMLQILGSYKVPTLLIDSYITHEDFYKMNLRDEEASFMATNLLIQDGHEKIALVTGKIDKSVLLSKRLEGYKRALKENDIPFEERFIFEGDVTYEYGFSVAQKIVAQADITAVVATADILAFGIMNYLQLEGKKIPDDFSIIGFDDTYQAKIMYPKLTTVGQNISKRGEMAGEIILNIIQNSQKEKETLMSCEIIKRETTKVLKSTK